MMTSWHGIIIRITGRLCESNDIPTDKNDTQFVKLFVEAYAYVRVGGYG